MTPRVLDMPDDPSELAPWLDRQLVGLDLAALVAELEVVHGRTSPAPAGGLAAALAGRLPDVLRLGLTAAPRSALGVLLRHPRMLLDLQSRVLLEGGPY